MIHEQADPKHVIAAFDFDGTLTYHDLLLPFLHYAGNTFSIASGIFCALPFLPLALAQPFYRQKAKETILSQVFRGKHRDALAQKGDEFAKNIIPSHLRPERMNKLLWHQKQGHRCILISANLDLFLEPWACYAGFHDLICSKVEIDEQQKLTGKLIGLNCWGAEKVRRLLQLAGPKTGFSLYAYGNGKGDRELLQLADYPFYRSF
jgi:phosphatidylglycerophosphatase C